MGIKDYSATPASNTTINSIDIAENCVPSNLNNAIRQLMADIAGYKPQLSVADYGAPGDGTDQTTEIQAAITAAGNATYGGAVYFPPGQYKITSTLTVPAGVALIGDGICDLDNPGNMGATIYVPSSLTATPAVTLDDGCVVKGINFYYPDQVTTSPPVAYDYAIELDLSGESIQGVDIEDVVIHNAYNGINLGGAFGGNIPGNTHITRVRAYCINTGIHVGYTLVNLFCDKCTFSPEFWLASAGQAVREWSIDNGEAIHYEEGTGMFLSNFGAFGLNRGIYVDGTASVKGLQFLQVSNSVFDGCRQCIVAAGNGAIQGGVFTGCTIQPKNGLDATDDACIGVFLSQSALVNKLLFSNCYFGPANGAHVSCVETTTGIQAWLQFTGCEFEIANKDSNTGTYYNISINDDLLSLLVDGCFFRNDTTDIICIKAFDIRDITVTSCQFYGSHDTAIDLTTVDRNAIIADNWSAATNGTTSCKIGTVSGTLKADNNIWDKDQSNSIASGTSIVLNDYSQYFVITGGTDIQTITAANNVWQDRIIYLKFTNATPGDLVHSTGNIEIPGGSSWPPAQNDIATLVYDGTNWQLVNTQS